MEDCAARGGSQGRTYAPPVLVCCVLMLALGSACSSTPAPTTSPTACTTELWNNLEVWAIGEGLAAQCKGDRLAVLCGDLAVATRE